jgi:hypothetical protein
VDTPSKSDSVRRGQRGQVPGRVGRASRRRLGSRAAVAGAAALLLGTALTTVPAHASPGQVVTPSTADVAAQTLGGPGVTVSNVTYTGAAGAIGTFSGMGAAGFDSGVMLSSGDVVNAVGPNQTSGQTTAFGTAGDAQLDALVGGGSTASSTFDAAVLEFDFVPTSNVVSFKYVFASEEYSEFVGAGVDDVFAFFVNNANCATVGGQRVSVDTINNGNPGNPSFTPSHPELYRDNTDPGSSGASVSPIDIQYDGLTTVLNCQATVTPGQTSHMKLAIADTGDEVLDSTVFLQADSFQSNEPPVCPASSVGVLWNQPQAVTLGATDPNTGDVLTYAITTQPQYGTLSGTAPNLTYTPFTNYIGPDSFAYTASDGKAGCGPATITLADGLAPPGIAVNKDVLRPGDSLYVTGAGFAPGSSVDITIESTPVLLGTVTADPTGAVASNVQIPNTIAAGVHTIKLTGQTVGGAVLVQSMEVTIASVITPVAPTTSIPTSFITNGTPIAAELPATGGVPWQTVSFGLVLIGIGLVLVGRERATR